MPQQPKVKARNSSTPHPPLPLPFQWPGLSLWQVPPYFLSIISPPFAHPHGPACHCGRSRLSTHFPHSLPSHLYTQPSVIPTSKARLVIVAGPAHLHLFLSPHPPLIFIPTPHPHHSGPACHCGRSRLVPSSSLCTSLPCLPIFCILFIQFFGPAYHCGRSRLPHFHYLPSTSPASFFCALPFLPITGPACHCGRSRLPLFTPPPSLFPSPLSPPPLPSLSSCRPARAGCHGRSKAILLTLFQLRSTSDLTGFPALREVPVAPDCLAVPHLPVPCYYDGLRRLAVLRFYVFGGGHGSLLRPCRVLPAVQDHLSGF